MLPRPRIVFIHLCRDADCMCEDSVLRGLVPASHLPPADPFEWITDAMEDVEMAFKRRTDTGPLKPPPNAWVDPVDKQENPNIFAWLTETKYDDNKPRMTGSISIFTQLGVLKASISDRDASKVAYVEALSLVELITVIEQAICDDSTEWKDSGRKPTY